MKPAPAIPIAVPAISVTYAPPPALVSADANAEHVGCTPKQIDAVLRAMAASPQHRASLVRLPGRGLHYAAPPDAVLRYLRTCAALPANEGAEVDAETQEARAAWG